MNKYTFIVILIMISFFFISCEGDCKDEKIEKVEWISKYVTKNKDTLVSYSIIENNREFIKAYEEIKHTITIRNNNNLYSNKFAVKFNCGVFDTYYGDQYKSNEYEYVTIEPKSTKTFIYYSQAGKYINYNSSYYVLQESKNIYYKERIEYLKIDSITVNSCSENVEALKEKYKAIKELYTHKIENKTNTDGQE